MEKYLCILDNILNLENVLVFSLFEMMYRVILSILQEK